MKTNKKIDFAIPSSERIQALKIEPGEYIVIGIWDTVHTMHSDGRISSTMEFGDIPEELMQIINISIGEAVYLGMFYTKSSSFAAVKQDVLYSHDFEKARKLLLQTFTVPEGMIIKDFL